MTDEEHLQFKKKIGDPPHLRNPRVNPFEERERQRASDSDSIHARLNTYVDAVYADYGPSNELIDAIFNLLHFRRFGTLPRLAIHHKEYLTRFGIPVELATGPADAKSDRLAIGATSHRLDQIQNVVLRIAYQPALMGHDPRTKTIHDYTGFDAKGNPEPFSRFFDRLVDNSYDSIRDKDFRDKKKSVHFEENPDARASSGGISEGHAMLNAALPTEGPLYTNWVYPYLALEFESERELLSERYPAISHAFFGMKIDSASKIARLVKEGKLQGSADSPRDRESIRKILDAFKRQNRDIVERFIRQRQADAIEADPHFKPKDLDNPEVMKQEVLRTLGMRARKKNPIDFAMPKRTDEQDLGWETYKIGKGNFSDHGDHCSFMASLRSGVLATE